MTRSPNELFWTAKNTEILADGILELMQETQHAGALQVMRNLLQVLIGHFRQARKLQTHTDKVLSYDLTYKSTECIFMLQKILLRVFKTRKIQTAFCHVAFVCYSFLHLRAKMQIFQKQCQVMAFLLY